MIEETIPAELTALIDELDSKLPDGESLELEFKRASGGLPRNLWETVSAFANTYGGWIILGINDQTRPFTIEGVPHAQERMSDFVTGCRNRNKINLDPCSAGDVWIQQIENKNLVIIRINPAPYSHRPVFIDGRPQGGTYVRRHESDAQCTETEIAQMTREGGSPAADAAVLSRFGWNDIDRQTFASYRQRFNIANPGAPEAGMDDEEFLIALNGCRHDRHSGQSGLTVAGLLMFGKSASIREWRGRHMFDFRDLPESLENAAFWNDRYVWEGNLLGAFERLLPRLTDRVQTPFQLEGRRPRDRDSRPPRAA